MVVMDNLSAHKVEGVRQRIEAAGAQLLYRPADSADFNPIEPAGSNTKQLLRSAQARTLEVLQQAVAQALAAVPAHNAAA